MKKLSAICLVALLTFTLSACTAAPTVDTTTTTTATAATSVTRSTTMHSPTVTTTLITRDRAIEIALQAAGLARADVQDLEAETEREQNGVFWEVEFEAGGYDYTYDIHAENGSIINQKREPDT